MGLRVGGREEVARNPGFDPALTLCSKVCGTKSLNLWVSFFAFNTGGTVWQALNSGSPWPSGPNCVPGQMTSLLRAHALMSAVRRRRIELPGGLKE